MGAEERPCEDIVRRFPRREPSGENKAAGALILDAYPPELWENKFLLLKKKDNGSGHDVVIGKD